MDSRYNTVQHATVQACEHTVHMRYHADTTSDYSNKVSYNGSCNKVVLRLPVQYAAPIHGPSTMDHGRSGH